MLLIGVIGTALFVRRAPSLPIQQRALEV
jgi:hypothetical protein